MTYKVIVALDARRGIGRAGAMPWRIPGELGWTSKTTKTTSSTSLRNALIMGRTTYLSVPAERRPLADRVSIVVTSRPLAVEPGTLVVETFPRSLEIADALRDIEDVFIFGGASIYRQALDRQILEEILISEIPGDHRCDTFFPDLPPSYILDSTTTARYDTTEVHHHRYLRAVHRHTGRS
ncbi:dihydrofolate reductase [Nocardia takedensis]|uniref:dihydrofolate reductase n=1 Tax=Nocardia takedensis TaxID=259390 RepID=UPI003F763D50